MKGGLHACDLDEHNKQVSWEDWAQWVESVDNGDRQKTAEDKSNRKFDRDLKSWSLPSRMLPATVAGTTAGAILQGS